MDAIDQTATKFLPHSFAKTDLRSRDVSPVRLTSTMVYSTNLRPVQWLDNFNKAGYTAPLGACCWAEAAERKPSVKITKNR